MRHPGRASGQPARHGGLEQIMLKSSNHAEELSPNHNRQSRYISDTGGADLEFGFSQNAHLFLPFDHRSLFSFQFLPQIPQFLYQNYQ